MNRGRQRREWKLETPPPPRSRADGGLGYNEPTCASNTVLFPFSTRRRKKPTTTTICPRDCPSSLPAGVTMIQENLGPVAAITVSIFFFQNGVCRSIQDSARVDENQVGNMNESLTKNH